MTFEINCTEFNLVVYYKLTTSSNRSHFQTEQQPTLAYTVTQSTQRHPQQPDYASYTICLISIIQIHNNI